MGGVAAPRATDPPAQAEYGRRARRAPASPTPRRRHHSALPRGFRRGSWPPRPGVSSDHLPRAERGPVLTSVRVARETWISDEMTEANRHREALPEPIVRARDEDPAPVATAEVPVRGDRGMRGAERLRDHTGHQIPLGVIVKEAD